MNEDFQAAWPAQASLHTHDDSARSNASTAQKQIVTIRLDIDMLNWFKAAGPGYQTRINQILRDHMEAHKTEEAQS
jgi:uncharacterized protein (DUF4415 family)